MTVATQVDLQACNVLSQFPMPMRFRPAIDLSDDELLAFSERNELHEIERNAAGELEVRMSPGGQGSRLEAMVISQLSQWTEAHGGVCFSSNSGFRLADGSMRAPDAAWLEQTRWNTLSKPEQEGYVPLCPDFLIEVLSRTDSRRSLELKMQQWMSNGAKLAWMIDPYEAAVSVYRPDAAIEVRSRPEFVEAGAPVPGFRLLTQGLWAE